MFNPVARVARIIQVVVVAGTLGEQRSGTKMVDLEVFKSSREDLLQETIRTSFPKIFADVRPVKPIIALHNWTRFSPAEVRHLSFSQLTRRGAPTFLRASLDRASRSKTGS